MPWIRNVLATVNVAGVGQLGMTTPIAPPLPPSSLEAALSGGPSTDATPIDTIPTGLRSTPIIPLDAAPSGPPLAAPLGSYAPPTGEVPRIDVAAPPIVQSLGGSTPVPPTVALPVADAAPTVLQPVVPPVAVNPLLPADDPAPVVVDAVAPRKKPWLPIALALLVVGAGLYWLLNRNDDSSTTATSVPATTAVVASGGATTAVVGGPTTVASATTAAAIPAAPLLETLQADGNHKTLLTALTAAGLNDTLKNGGPYTIFAPTDAAFAQLPAGTLDKLLANKDALNKVLLFHVVSGNLGPNTLTSGPIPSLEGDPLTVKIEGANITVNSAAATPTAKAGNVYSIDKVLLPPNALPTDGTTAPATAAPIETTVAPATTPAPAVTTAPPAATTAAPVAPPAPKPGTVSVYFNAASSSLTQEATVALTDLAKKIRASGPKTVVKITGYADDRGTPANIALVSKERAQRVADYLVSLGAQADYKVISGGAIPGTDYDKARRTDIEIG